VVPNVLHVVFGLAPDFGGRPFSLVHALALRSAWAVNRFDATLFHHAHEPTGPMWDWVRPRLERVRVTPPTEVFGRPVRRVEHQADVVRLDALLRHGGVYLDLDTLSVRPLAPLYHHASVLGREQTPGSRIQGLCNAVILAEPGSSFVARWREAYRTFDGDYWHVHSVVVPRLLAERAAPGEVHVEPPASFFCPSWDDAGLADLFERDLAFPLAYVHHLWAGRSWDRYLRDLDEPAVRQGTSTYARLARAFL
jgi:hypothetical protein